MECAKRGGDNGKLAPETMIIFIAGRFGLPRFGCSDDAQAERKARCSMPVLLRWGARREVIQIANSSRPDALFEDPTIG